MSWNLSCHFLFRLGAHKETINNIFVLSRRCVIVNTLFTQCIVSCRMVSSFRHICDHCCFSMPPLIALVRTINIHYKSQCFKQQMSHFKHAPLHLTQKTQSSNSGSKVKDKKYWFSKHEDKYQRELTITSEYWVQFMRKKTLHDNLLYPFLFNYYGQIVFVPLLGHNLQILCQEVCAFVCIPSQWMWPIFLFLYTACSLIARIMMLAPNWPNFLVSVCKIGQWNKSWPAGEIEFANFCLMLIVSNQ